MPNKIEFYKIYEVNPMSYHCNRNDVGKSETLED